MSETWLFNNPPEGALLSLDEVVRIELTPQIIGMVCNETNLSNLVTHGKYRVGAMDAYGRVIGKDIDFGDMMYVVDFHQLHVPKVWTVYRWQERVVSMPGRPVEKQNGWHKIHQFDNFNDALTAARKLRKEMSSDAIHH